MTITIYCLGQLTICPKADTGTLLACLHQDGDPKPGKINPRPDNIIVLGSKCRIVNKMDTKCTLWLVVNDAVLENDDRSRRAYLEIEDDSDPKIYYPPENFKGSYNANDPMSWSPIQRWRYIVKHQYWQLWYDDNIGFYQIQIDFDRQSLQAKNWGLIDRLLSAASPAKPERRSREPFQLNQGKGDRYFMPERGEISCN